MTDITKNKAGVTIGFVLGMVGFLLLFKVFFLTRIPPEDEIAPGIVVVVSVLSGLVFAVAGHLTQQYLAKRRK